jgi:transposase
MRDAVAQLMTIPGVSRVSAQVILAEIGADMTPVPTSGHLLSWAGLVPRLDESAGKRRSSGGAGVSWANQNTLHVQQAKFGINWHIMPNIW